MAIKYLSHIETLNIDMQQNELLNPVVHNVTNATRPSTPFDGQIIYNSSSSTLEVWNGTAWVSTGGDITAVITNSGSGLSGGVTSGAATLGVVVDTTTIEINTNTIQAKTAPIVDGGTGLATADQIYDFVIGLNYSTTVGTVTSVAISGNDGISVADSPITTDGTIALGLNDNSITNGKLVNSSVTYGTTTVALGGTSTAIAGLTELDFAVGDRVIGASIGANNLTLGATTSTVVIPGNLTVNGTLLTKDSQEVNIGDAIIKLNAEENAAPTENAGIEVERGTSTNVSLIWNETDDRWTFTNDGSNYHNIPVPTEYDNFNFSVSDGTNTQEVSDGGTVTFAAGQVDSIDGLTVAVSDDDIITYTHADTSSQASVNNSNRTYIQDITLDTYGHITGITSAAETVVDTNTQLATASAVIDLSVMADDSTALFTHNLTSEYLIVQLYDTDSNQVVNAEIQHTSTDSISIIFANTGTEMTANSLGNIRIVVIDAKEDIDTSGTVTYS